MTKISSLFPTPFICSCLNLEVPTPEEESLILISSVVVLKPINISLAGTLTLVPLNMLKTHGVFPSLCPGEDQQGCPGASLKVFE